LWGFKVGLVLVLVGLGVAGGISAALAALFGETAAMCIGAALFAIIIVLIWQSARRTIDAHSKLPADWRKR
jgi:hypothetical protein